MKMVISHLHRKPKFKILNLFLIAFHMTFFLQISQPYEKLPTYPHIRVFLVFFFFNLFFYFSRRDPSVIKIVRLKLIE